MNKMVKNCKEKCSGCGSCLHLCLKHAISIEYDERGNKYPYIDEKKCIKCNLCRTKCLFDKYEKRRKKKNCYAGYSVLDNIYNKSSSGGIFGTIAYNFIKQGGIVCGCSLEFKNESISFEHIIISDIKQIAKIQGSKYIQSNIVDILPKIKKLLDEGKKVLFSGTPCQIVGLKQFLKKEYDNLYTIDIVCHGAPDKKVFLDYISFIEEKKQVKITDVVFRDKKIGHGLQGYLCGYYKKNNKEFKMLFNNTDNSYYYLFQRGYLYRPNCYNCRYASDIRPGDLTIGDYWGIQKEHPEIKTNRAISCVITNSEKGVNLLNIYGDDLILIDSTFEKIQKNNEQLQHPTKEPLDNKKILEDYNSKGYLSIEKHFYRICGRFNIYKSRMKNIIKNKINK